MSRLPRWIVLTVSLAAMAQPVSALAEVCTELGEAMIDRCGCPLPEFRPEPLIAEGAASTTLQQAIDGQANVVVGEGLLVEFPRSGQARDLRVHIEWFKSSGTCAVPITAGQELFSEVGFTLRRPDGQLLELVQLGDWTGAQAQNGNPFETEFHDSGQALSVSALPAGGPYEPAGGALDSMLDGAGTGTWDLLATDAAPGAELCVYGWSLEFASAASRASWGSSPPALPPQSADSWTGLQTVDGTTEAEVGAGLVLSGVEERSPSDLRVSITWTKTDGSCTAQAPGAAYHEEVGFALRRPDGLTRQLVLPGTYSGNDDIGLIVTTFDDLALTTPLPGRPVSGSYRAADGTLEDLLDGPSDGVWQLLATDQGPGDPLCVLDWSIEVDHVTHSAGDVLPFAAGPFAELREVALGDRHGLAWGCDGALWAWGDNAFGEVGTGTLNSEAVPVQLSAVDLGTPESMLVGTQSSENVQQRIAAGREHSLALAADSLLAPGAVLAWGSGAAGQLGQGTFNDLSTPTEVSMRLSPLTASATPIQVAAGDLHSLALFSNGQVVGWGDNNFGQLAVSGLYNVLSPLELPLLMPADLSPFGVGPQHLAFSSLASGGSFTLGTQAPQLCVSSGDCGGECQGNPCPGLVGVLPVDELGEDGVVWAWGDDSHGQLGQGDVNAHTGLGPVQVLGLPPFVVVAAGSDHALALDEETGLIWSWGNNDEGQLGRPTQTTIDQATAIPIADLPRITAIAAGLKFSVAVDEYGRLWGWGRNDVGQLADANTASVSVPQLLDVGTEFSCSLAVQAGFDSVVARDCGYVCDDLTPLGVPTAPDGVPGDPQAPPPPPPLPAGYHVDTDNDLINDLIEGGTLSTPTDFDGGGRPDFEDIDSDNDGILDCFEAGRRYIALPPVDTDGDGLPDFRDLDSDNDGIPDGVEGTADPDGDGLGNFIDTDSDGDGIPDSGESSGDLDGDGIPDSADTDVDGDGIPNATEGTLDPDGDGNGNEVDFDSDGDGISDALETAVDSDGDGLPDFLDHDSDNDGVSDANEFGYDSNGDGLIEASEESPSVDSDGDGILNFRDSDSDDDGISDGSDGLDDFDGDGRPNFVDSDSDGDGLADSIEGEGDPDLDFAANFLDLDSDNDGVPDSIEGAGDKDFDGLGNFVDLDSDNDGIDDALAGAGDLDGDSLLNFLDPDADGDLIANLVEGVDDPDGDGVANFLDLDSDGDYMPDLLEGVADLDGDGAANYIDTDSDGDGVLDSVYGIASNGSLIPPDLDNDAIANHLDPDSDGDGISNVDEGMNDFDGDGLINPLDFDSDGDGIPDRVEGVADVDGDGLPDYLDNNPSDGSESDPDADALRTIIEELYGLDPLNPDSDFDGIPDGLEFSPTLARDEGEPADTDLDGIIDALDEDSDGDGWPDAAEAPLDPNNPPDTDGDGIYDFRDLDSDNDGLSDHEELLAGTSPVNGDSDGDGIPDGEELANGTDPMGGAIPAQLVAQSGCMSSLSGGQPQGAASLLAAVLLLAGLRRRRLSLVRVGPAVVCLLLLAACDNADVEPPEVEATAPRLSLSGDLEVDEESLVSLEASAIDADGDVQTWQWQQTSGEDVELLVSDAPRAVFFAPTAVATLELIFSVRVTDAQGLSAEGQLAVTVLPVNLAPEVNAGSDQRVDEGTTVLLSGAVADADGTIESWSWSVLDGDGIELSEGEGFAASFEAPVVDSELPVLLQLQATDDEGAVAGDQVRVVVSPTGGVVAPNSPPQVSAGADQEVSEGVSVSLLGSVADVDGSIGSVSWSQLSGPLVELSTEVALSTQFTSPSVLSDTLLTFEVVAVDDLGASAADRVDVLVLDGNQPPLVSAGPDQVVGGGDVVILSGQAADLDGSVTNTVWTQLSGSSVSLSSPYAAGTSFVAPSSATGETLSFRLLCQDDGGATVSDDVDVEILPTNQPPVVSAGADQTVLSGDVVQLSGSATDSDGTVVVVDWVQSAGQAVVLADPSSTNTQFTAASTETEVLTFVFSATDDDGEKAGATVDITVEVPVLVIDSCCGALPGGGPGSALVCLDLAAFGCVETNDPFCTNSSWDATCAELYRGVFGPCGPASTCN